MGGISVTAISIVGLYIIVAISKGDIVPYVLCIYPEYQSFRYYSIITCFFFLYIYFQIRKSILAHPRETQLDIRVLDYQLDTLRKLRGSFLILFAVSLTLVILDQIAKIRARLSGKQERACNSGFEVPWLNSIYYLITRTLST